MRKATMPDKSQEREERIKSVFAAATKKAETKLAGRAVELDYQSSSDGAVIIARRDARELARLHFSIGEDHSIYLGAGMVELGELYDSDADDAVGNAINNEVRRRLES
jgi:hypothetical protein